VAQLQRLAVRLQSCEENAVGGPVENRESELAQRDRFSNCCYPDKLVASRWGTSCGVVGEQRMQLRRVRRHGKDKGPGVTG